MFQPPRLIATSVLLLICVCAPARAQISERLDSALRAIYAENAFTAEALVQPTWLGAGDRYATVSPAGDIVAHDAASGSEETLVRATDLTDPGGGRIPIAAYAFSADQSRVLIFTNTRRVWRLNTRGDYWVFDRTSGKLRKLGGDAPPSSLMFAKFSPDGNRVAYFRSNDIYVEDVQKGNIIRLTTDGGEAVVNGAGDWVNEEELFLRDAFRWSPDGRRIAYWQFDTSGVGRFTLINNTDQLYPETTRFAYPKAGTTNSRVRVGIVRADGGGTLWLKQPGDPREHYIPRMTWLDAGGRIRQPRGTPVPKGARWRKSVYGSLGDLSSREQAETLQAFAADRPWVDLDRVGIYGASGGGSATLNVMFRFPDLYKVGVAMAPGADQRLYDTIYQERYMGLPDENPEGYRRGSPINFAQGLRGRLLLMHGTADDNVHMQGTERLVNRLVELGKDVDLMIYPNRTHALAEGPGTVLHRWRTVARYLTEHLPPGP